MQKSASLYFIKAALDCQPDAATAKTLAGLQQQAVAATEVEKVDFSRGLPYTKLDQDVCRAMGAYYQRRDKSPMTLWAPVPTMWSNTSPFARPAKAGAVKLHADMMRGEREPVAFNVSNNTTQPLAVSVKVGNLGKWSAASVEKRLATHVLSMGFLFFDDALTPFGNETVTIPPGMTRQVWLILNSRGVAPGSYKGLVTVSAAGKSSQLPLTATVYPVEMPARPQYISQTWGYYSWKPAVGFEQQAAAEMERAYETGQCLHHAYMPWPKVDPQTKKLVRPIELDFTKLDEMLALRPYVRQWLLWPGLEFGAMSLNYGGQANDMPAIGTPEHTAIFKEWVRQIRDHMAAKGYPTSDWAFFWVDEPDDDAFLKLIVPASKLAKEVDPTILVWETDHVSLEALKAHPDAIDIHCCTGGRYRNEPDLLAYVLAGKVPSTQYECASSKSNDPHTYYRLHHLTSAALGLGGAGMWVWADSGGQFSDYDGAASYGMVYATGQGPITGKRREAWREGIEDFELFRHLRERATKTGDADLKAMHDDGLKQVLKAEGSYGQNFGTVQDLMALRLRILKTLAGK